MTVKTAARETASHSTRPETPYAEGTTRAATLAATLSHAVLMLRHRTQDLSSQLRRQGTCLGPGLRAQAFDAAFNVVIEGGKNGQ